MSTYGGHGGRENERFAAVAEQPARERCRHEQQKHRLAQQVGRDGEPLAPRRAARSACWTLSCQSFFSISRRAPGEHWDAALHGTAVHQSIPINHFGARSKRALRSGERNAKRHVTVRNTKMCQRP
jgi:hypothetical protein